jgi:hypothetical protein
VRGRPSTELWVAVKKMGYETNTVDGSGCRDTRKKCEDAG